MADHDGYEYSTLEVVQNNRQSLQRNKPLPAESDKQVVSALLPAQAEKQVVEDPENAVLPYSKEENVHYAKPRRSRRKWIVIGVIAVIIVVAAVLGGVLGSRKKSKAGRSSSSQSLNSTGSNIAAVSFVYNNANRSRVFFQDGTGELRQASDSEDGSTWTSSKLGFVGRNDTAIAAAVSRYAPLEMSIFYTDNDYIIHDIIYDSTTKNYTEGVLAEQKYKAGAGTNLAGLYHQCVLCGNNTVIVFQDINGLVQFANLTDSGWELTQLNIDPIAGTGLALDLFLQIGAPDNINVFSQRANLSLTQSVWSPALSKIRNQVNLWTHNFETTHVAAARTPLAVASSANAYTSVKGFDLWLELMSLSDQGVEVDTWTGAVNGWYALENHPSALSNSTANNQTYTSIAVTNAGKAFAVVTTNVTEIQSWEFNENLVDWTSTGTVDIGAAWE